MFFLHRSNARKAQKKHIESQPENTRYFFLFLHVVKLGKTYLKSA